MTDTTNKSIPAPPPDMTPDERFFFEHAGYSVRPTETDYEGRVRSAREAAAAEREGRARDFSFVWEIDRDTDSSEHSDEKPAYKLWTCVAYDVNAKIIAFLGGIDFGRGGTPHGSTYRRVVEAELAAEALT